MADITAEICVAAAASNASSKLAQKEQSLLKSQDSASYGSSRRAAGRPREEGAVLRVVRAVTGSAVKPRLLSQSSLPAVEHAAPTKPSQPPAAGAASNRPTQAMTAAEKEATAAAEHTAMLNRYKAAWKVTPQDCFWTRVYKHMEWRVFWCAHLTALIVLDHEERVIALLVYMAVLGLVMYEFCRRVMGLAGLW